MLGSGGKQFGGAPSPHHLFLGRDTSGSAELPYSLFKGLRPPMDLPSSFSSGGSAREAAQGGLLKGGSGGADFRSGQAHNPRPALRRRSNMAGGQVRHFGQ